MLWVPAGPTADRSDEFRGSNLAPSQKWLDSLPSIFKFASSDLESRYQDYVSDNVSSTTLGCCVLVTLQALPVLLKVLSTPPNARPSALAVLIPVGFNVVPAVAVAGLITFWPTVYTRRYALIHMVLSLLQMGVSNYVRELYLWTNRLHARSPHAFAGGVTTFVVENSFLFVQWLRVLIFPTNQVCDLATVALLALLNVAGNGPICRKWGASLLSTSPPVVHVMHTVSSAMLTAVGPRWGPDGFPRPDSCAAALAFWQIVGWWWASMVVLAGEVARRRAFLFANLHLLGPHAHKSARWPSGSVFIVLDCLLIVLSLSFGAALVWAACLVALN